MTDGADLLAAILAHPKEDTPRLMFADWLDENGGQEEHDRAEFIRVQIELARGPAGIDCSHMECYFQDRAILSSKTCVCRPTDSKILAESSGPLLGERVTACVRNGSMWTVLTGVMSRYDLSAEEGRSTFTLEGVTGGEWRPDLRFREQKLLAAYRHNWKWLGGNAPLIMMEKTYRRGFVADLVCSTQAWMEYGKEITATCPIESVRVEAIESSAFGPRISVLYLSSQELKKRWPHITFTGSGVYHVPLAAA